MTTEVEKAIKKMEGTKDPIEKAHIKAEIDQMPISSGELEQAQQSEADRLTHDKKVFNEARNR